MGSAASTLNPLPATVPFPYPPKGQAYMGSGTQKTQRYVGFVGGLGKGCCREQACSPCPSMTSWCLTPHWHLGEGVLVVPEGRP